MEKIEALIKAIKEELSKADGKKKMPGVPPAIDPADHPSVIKPENVGKLVKDEEDEVLKVAGNGQWSLEKAASDRQKDHSWETALKAHPGVKSATVQRNHPDHPGHTYMHVEHTTDATDHVNRIVGHHGSIHTESGPDQTDEDHHGKALYESQFIVKPHAKPKPGMSKLSARQPK